MASKEKAITPEEAEDREIAVLERLALLYAAKARRTGVLAPSTAVAAPIEDTGWASLPRSDAIVEYLKTQKRSQTPKQIWLALERAGCEAEAEDPVEAVKWALKKLVKNDTSVVKVGYGKWHHKRWYKTKSALEKVIAKGAGRGGRTTNEHAKRTLEGMERRRAAGKHIGRPGRVTADHIAKFKAARVAGATIREACKEAGFSISYHGANKADIDAWVSGAPWPPINWQKVLKPNADTSEAFFNANAAIESGTYYDPKTNKLRVVK